MTASKVKLIKVTDGLYRTENGGCVVMRDWCSSTRRPAVASRWIVRFDDWCGARVEKRFNTLAEVREFLSHN